jgi:hypothetical protein
MIDEQEVLRRARQAVGPCPPNSFQYGAYEMALERAKETARKEIEAKQRQRTVGGLCTWLSYSEIDEKMRREGMV